MAQWIARVRANAEVAGSSPTIANFWWTCMITELPNFSFRVCIKLVSENQDGRNARTPTPWPWFESPKDGSFAPTMQRELSKGACAPQAFFSSRMPSICISVCSIIYCTCSGSTYIKIGTIQRRLAWPLRKDDTQIREAFQILSFISYQRGRVGDLLTVLAHAHMGNKKKRLKKESKTHSMGQELY